MAKFVMDEAPNNYGSKTIEERFFEKVKVREDGCWDWIPSHRDSSGRPRYRQISACVWAYLHFKGNVPDGLEVSHTCLKKDCVNPNHMTTETHKENCNRGDLFFSKLYGGKL